MEVKLKALRKIYFHYLDRRIIYIKNKTTLKNFIAKVFHKEQKEIIRVDCIFCSDEYLIKINKKFLRHNFYTDIITFDLSGDNQKVAAEIYISADRVKENAQKNNVFIYKEVYRVLFHGVLHLCGYKDKTLEEIKIMREKEDFYLDLYNTHST